MNSKSKRLAALLAPHQGGELDPHYVAFFDLFNRQLFFEAHEVLEPLWLRNRHAVDAAFYKGLIQLAGAFVHVQKRRFGPAVSLFKLAEANFNRYPTRYHRLSFEPVHSMITQWIERLQTIEPAALTAISFPKLNLESRKASTT